MHQYTDEQIDELSNDGWTGLWKEGWMYQCTDEHIDELSNDG